MPSWIFMAVSETQKFIRVNIFIYSQVVALAINFWWLARNLFAHGPTSDTMIEMIMMYGRILSSRCRSESHRSRGRFLTHNLMIFDDDRDVAGIRACVALRLIPIDALAPEQIHKLTFLCALISTEAWATRPLGHPVYGHGPGPVEKILIPGCCHSAFWEGLLPGSELASKAPSWLLPSCFSTKSPLC